MFPENVTDLINNSNYIIEENNNNLIKDDIKVKDNNISYISIDTDDLILEYEWDNNQTSSVVNKASDDVIIND